MVFSVSFANTIGLGAGGFTAGFTGVFAAAGFAAGALGFEGVGVCAINTTGTSEIKNRTMASDYQSEPAACSWFVS